MEIGYGMMSLGRETRAAITGIFIVMVALFSGILFAAHESMAMEVAILQSSDITAYQDAVSGFKGAGPGNAIYTEYDMQGDLELGKKLARKVRASNAALVVAVGLKAALAAQLEIVDIPIVYMMILDPLKHRLNAPNMTGTLLEVPIDRQLKVMRKMLPSIRRLGILHNPAKTGSQLNGDQAHAGTFGFQLQHYPVESEKQVPQQLRKLLSETDALWLTPDSTVLTNDSVRFILDTALGQRVPTIAFSPEFTRLGALLSISASYTQVGRETAQLARRILDGQVILPLNPVPIERLTISVNMKTAKFLNVSFNGEATKMIDETY